MKPTERQKEVIRKISKFIDAWEGSNDIDSPTLEADIESFVDDLETLYAVNKESRTDLELGIYNILDGVQYMD